jgi:hypothetical protein
MFRPGEDSASHRRGKMDLSEFGEVPPGLELVNVAPKLGLEYSALLEPGLLKKPNGRADW